MHDAVPAISALGISPIVRIPDLQGWMIKRKLSFARSALSQRRGKEQPEPLWLKKTVLVADQTLRFVGALDSGAHGVSTASTHHPARYLNQRLNQTTPC